MRKQLSFADTQQGHGNQYYSIANKRGLDLGAETTVRISSPKEVNVGDCLQIPETYTYNFIVQKVLDSQHHANRTTPNCQIMTVRVVLVYIGNTELNGKYCSVFEYLKDQGVEI